MCWNQHNLLLNIQNLFWKTLPQCKTPSYDIWGFLKTIQKFTNPTNTIWLLFLSLFSSLLLFLLLSFNHYRYCCCCCYCYYCLLPTMKAIQGTKLYLNYKFHVESYYCYYYLLLMMKTIKRRKLKKYIRHYSLMMMS